MDEITPQTDWDSELVESETDEDLTERPPGPDPRFGADFVTYFDE